MVWEIGVQLPLFGGCPGRLLLAGTVPSSPPPKAVFEEPDACREGQLAGADASSHSRPRAVVRTPCPSSSSVFRTGARLGFARPTATTRRITESVKQVAGLASIDCRAARRYRDSSATVIAGARATIRLSHRAPCRHRAFDTCTDEWPSIRIAEGCDGSPCPRRVAATMRDSRAGGGLCGQGDASFEFRWPS